MSKKKIIEAAEKKGIFLYEDHKLVTRRDFLAAGAIQFSAAVMAPTVMSALMKSSVAQAADCADVGAVTSGLPAFVHLQLSGGCGLAMNYIPRRKDGLIPTSLDLMGLGSRTLLESNRPNSTTQNRLETELGVSQGFFFRSGFLAGLRQAATNVAANANVPDAAKNYLNNTAFIAVPVPSRDDTNINRVGLVSLVAKAGLVGTKMNVLTGQGFGASPALIPPPTPIAVNSVADLDSAVGVAAPLGSMSKIRQEATFKLIQDLSEARAAQLLASNASVLQDAVECSTSKNVEVAKATKPATDPRPIPALQGIWNIAANTNAGSREVVFAGCVYNAVIDQAGAVQMNNGGNDYHNNTRTAGDAKDQENGLIVGRILMTAASQNKRVFVYVTSDGSVRSPESEADDAVWTSDRGQAGLAYVLVYDPAGRPALGNPVTEAGAVALPNQIGYFTDGQNADGGYLTNWDPERASLAVFANYLKFHYKNALTGGAATWLASYKAVARPASLTAGLPQDVFSDQQLNILQRF